MLADKLLKYVMSGQMFRHAASILRHMIGQRYDVIFAAGSQVDLQWVMSAYEATRLRGLSCAFAGPELRTPEGACYFNLPARLFWLLRTRAIVTATTGLRPEHMPRCATHKIAIPHSLVSLHMVYPARTFSPYTAVFCCGAHHLAELNAMNRLEGRTDRRPVLVGYGKAERLLATRPVLRETSDTRKHILIGPSWGKGNILETIGEELLDRLLAEDFRVTLRPHPSFFIGGDEKLVRLIERWQKNDLFRVENSIDESLALWTADYMIADYSGFAMEFAFMRERPVLYVNVAHKVLNPNWEAFGVVPIELSIRDRIGTVVAPQVNQIIDGLRKLSQNDTEWPDKIRHERDAAWANFGRFGEACAAELSNMLAGSA